MSDGEIDILTLLHSASSEIDDLCRKAKRLSEQSHKLGDTQRESMPKLAGQWSKVAVNAHVDMLQEWIRTPVRSRNRQLLQRSGVDTHLLAEELFDHSDKIEKVADQLATLFERVPAVRHFVLSDESFPSWIRHGVKHAELKLAKILENANRYERVDGSGVPTKLKTYLMSKAISDPDRLSSVEDALRHFELVVEFGIEVDGSEDVDCERQCSLLTEVGTLIETLRTEFPEEADVLRHAVPPLSLEGAKTTVAKMIEQCSTEKSELLRQWHDLQNSLDLLGGEGNGSPPRTLSSLRASIESRRADCIAKLGSEGMELLAFLQERTGFPRHLSSDSIERALISLRPIILRAIQEGNHDA